MQGVINIKTLKCTRSIHIFVRLVSWHFLLRMSIILYSTILDLFKKYWRKINNNKTKKGEQEEIKSTDSGKPGRGERMTGWWGSSWGWFLIATTIRTNLVKDTSIYSLKLRAVRLISSPLYVCLIISQSTTFLTIFYNYFLGYCSSHLAIACLPSNRIWRTILYYHPYYVHSIDNQNIFTSFLSLISSGTVCLPLAFPFPMPYETPQLTRRTVIFCRAELHVVCLSATLLYNPCLVFFGGI